jgi:hypothetical protein
VILLSGVGLLLGLQTACDDTIIGHGAPIGTSCLRDPPLDWENFGRGMMGKHCTGCHSVFQREGQRNDAPLNVNIDTYEDVLLWADRIQERSINTTGMPPGGGMLEYERDLVEEWLRCDVFPALGQVQLEGVGGEEE